MARGTKGGAGAKQKTDKVPEKELGEKKQLQHFKFSVQTTKSATFLQGNLKKALAMTDKPMKVNSECQQYRKSRIGELWVFVRCHMDGREDVQELTKWKTLSTSFWCRKWMVRALTL